MDERQEEGFENFKNEVSLCPDDLAPRAAAAPRNLLGMNNREKRSSSFARGHSVPSGCFECWGDDSRLIRSIFGEHGRVRGQVPTVWGRSVIAGFSRHYFVRIFGHFEKKNADVTQKSTFKKVGKFDSSICFVWNLNFSQSERIL